MGVHYLLFHTVSGAWGEQTTWIQDFVYNIFLTAPGKVTQVLCAQKLVRKGDLYKGLNIGEGLWATARVR